MCVQIEKVHDGSEGSPGLYRVTGLMNDGSEVVDEYNTVRSLISLSHVAMVTLLCLLRNGTSVLLSTHHSHFSLKSFQPRKQISGFLTKLE